MLLPLGPIPLVIVLDSPMMFSLYQQYLEKKAKLWRPPSTEKAGVQALEFLKANAAKVTLVLVNANFSGALNFVKEARIFYSGVMVAISSDEFRRAPLKNAGCDIDCAPGSLPKVFDEMLKDDQAT